MENLNEFRLQFFHFIFADDTAASTDSDHFKELISVEKFNEILELENADKKCEKEVLVSADNMLESKIAWKIIDFDLLSGECDENGEKWTNTHPSYDQRDVYGNHEHDSGQGRREIHQMHQTE